MQCIKALHCFFEKRNMQITYNNSTIKKNTTIEYDPTVKHITEEVFAPVMCDFAGWVLKSAEAKGIKRLYFLARDGWIMYNTAVIIARRYGFTVEPRYLYCSRMSLRNAALGDLGDEAYRYLLEGGFALTPEVILGRLRLDAEERKEVYEDIAFEGNEKTEMGKAAAANFCGRLRGSKVYNSYVKKVWEASKPSAEAYLRQEGLFSDTAYALVDSGWTGSMQKMFRILTGKKQTGYYFGLYSSPDPENGEFYPYLFDKDTSPFIVSRFNNHLFEALCAAPHGMTAGYEEREGEGVFPIMNGEKSLNSESPLLRAQENILYDYAEASYMLPEKITDIRERQSFAFPLLDRLMFRPDKDTARIYGDLRFSDDPSELYSFPLACGETESKRLYFIPRLAEKFFRKGRLNRPLYWGYGTASICGKGRFCRANLRLWEVLWLLKR